MSMVNILHIINGWPAGGITEQAYLQCKYLSQDQFRQYSIGYCHFDGAFVKKFEDVGVECIHSDEQYGNLKDVLIEKNINVVVKQTGGGDYPAYVDLLHEMGIPLVEFLHCPRASIIPIGKVAEIQYTTPYTLEKNDAEHQKIMRPVQYALDLQSPIVGIRNIPTEEVWPICVGRLGRIVPDKRPDVLLNLAHACLALYGNKIQFKIAGLIPQDIPYHVEYGKAFLQQCEMLPNVEYCGFVDDKYEFWKSLDICLNPVWETSFDIVFLEAMACGVPIVTWDNSAAKYVVRNAGIVTKPDNASLFCGMKRLIDSPLTRRVLRENGLSLIENVYSLKNYIEFHINEYTRIANV